MYANVTNAFVSMLTRSPSVSGAVDWRGGAVVAALTLFPIAFWLRPGERPEPRSHP